MTLHLTPIIFLSSLASFPVHVSLVSSFRFPTVLIWLDKLLMLLFCKGQIMEFTVNNCVNCEQSCGPVELNQMYNVCCSNCSLCLSVQVAGPVLVGSTILLGFHYVLRPLMFSKKPLSEALTKQDRTGFNIETTTIGHSVC